MEKNAGSSRSATNSQLTTSSTKPKTPLKQLVQVDLVHQRVDSFENVNIPKNCSKIDASRNRLKNFLGLPQLKLLTNLTVDDNPILSFQGATQQPSLFWISMKKTPVLKHTHFKLMCVIVFGSQLKFINGETVSKNLIQKADSLREKILPELTAGNILINLSPIKYIVPQEKRSCTATFTIITDNGNNEENLYPSQPSIAAICERIIKDNDVSFISSEKLNGIRSKIQDMREHFQNFEEEEDEAFLTNQEEEEDQPFEEEDY